jgi:hypothetical protein
MGVLSIANGSQTATINTEHSLSSQTGVGIYVLVIDTANMASGDVLVIRLKTKYYTGGTVRTMQTLTYNDAQTEPNKYSLPVPVDTQIDCTLQQTAGTGRVFPWNLLRM